MATKRTTPNEDDEPVNHIELEAVDAKATDAKKRAERVDARLDRFKGIAAAANGRLVKGQVSGFVTFLREQSVVGLAIGLVLGTQAKALVDQMIASFINPLVGLLLPGEGSLKDKAFYVTFDGKIQKFGWGAFVLSLLTFLVVAAVVYYVFKGLGLDKLDKKKES